MARIPLVCPIDGSSLGAANANVNGVMPSGTDVNNHDHIHLMTSFQLTCQQGHAWSSDVHIVLMRVS